MACLAQLTDNFIVVSCFFMSNTYFQKSFMGEAVFLLLKQSHELEWKLKIVTP
jgi:hypothetical protein